MNVNYHSIWPPPEQPISIASSNSNLVRPAGGQLDPLAREGIVPVERVVAAAGADVSNLLREEG